MTDLKSVMTELESKGSEKTRRTLGRHGLPINRMFGVSNADLKVLAKKIKGQQSLALELYDTGNVDAMYLAGLVADGSKMGRKELQSWAESADGMPMIAEYSVPFVTVESPHGSKLAVKWAGSNKEQVASSGWCTYSGLVATKPDDALDLKEIDGLLKAIVKKIGVAPNRTRYTMNGFVIAVGSYVRPLTSHAKAAAEQMGIVSVDMGDTACAVPSATACIAKAEASGRIGVKRKTIRC